MVRHDRRAAVGDRFEYVRVRRQAQALLPRVVRRCEVLVDVVALGQVAFEASAQDRLRGFGAPAAELEAQQHQQHVLPAHEVICDAQWQHALQFARDRVFGRQRDDVRGRALEHRHVRRRLRHRRHERHRRRTAADHHHALARVVDVLRPLLRVHDRPREALAAGEGRRVAFVVAVVAAAHHHEAGADPHLLARVLAARVHRPAPPRAVELGAHSAMVEADQLLDAVVGRRLAHVSEDRGPVRDRLRVFPRPERVPERVHVRVRADARVAEQVPRPSDALARLEDRDRLARALRFQMARCADPREPRADDQHVDVLEIPVGVRLRPHAVLHRTGHAAKPTRTGTPHAVVHSIRGAP